MTKWLLSIVLIAWVFPAQAQTWLLVSGISAHTKSGYNGNNVGVGMEWQVKSQWSAAVGTYRNSEYHTTAYALGKYHWWRGSGFAVNFNMGTVTGYHLAPLVPVILPEICWHWACGMIIPAFSESGASAAAFYLRIPY